MAKPKKAGLGIGGIVLVVAIVLLARVLGIDLPSSEEGQPSSTAKPQREISAPDTTTPRSSRNSLPSSVRA